MMSIIVVAVLVIAVFFQACIINRKQRIIEQQVDEQRVLAQRLRKQTKEIEALRKTNRAV